MGAASIVSDGCAMNFDIDNGKLMYALGIIFAGAALLYFGRDVVFRLSITVKALLLAFAFVGFFVGGLWVTRDVLDLVSFALSMVAYVVFLGYVIVKYDPGETGTFVLFGVSAALFIGLGYGLREWDLAVSRRTATAVVVVLVVASGLLVGADVLGPGVTYETTYVDSVTLDGEGDGPRGPHEYDSGIGAVTVTNDFVFTRPMDLPEFGACVVGASSGPEDVYVSYAAYDRPDVVRGGATHTFDLRVEAYAAPNQTIERTYVVEASSDCEAERSEPTVLIWRTDETRPFD